MYGRLYAPQDTAGAWETVADPSTGKTYYHNTVTGETSWENPAGAPSSPLSSVHENTATAGTGGVDPSEWREAQDPLTGQTYFYNEVTGETSWENPLNLGKPGTISRAGSQHSFADSTPGSSPSWGEDPTNWGHIETRGASGSVQLNAFDPKKAFLEQGFKEDQHCKKVAEVDGSLCWKRADIDGWCLRHFYKNVVTIETAEPGTAEKLAEDLYKVEQRHIRKLKRAYYSFELRLRTMLDLNRQALPKEDIDIVFLNARDLLVYVHEPLYKDIKRLYYRGGLLTSELAGAFQAVIPYFSHYKDYLLGYPKASARLEALRKNHKLKLFHEFMELNEKAEGVQLEELLLTPLSQISLYLSLLRGMMNGAGGSRGAFQELVQQMQGVAASLYEALKMQDAQARVRMLQDNIDQKVDLVGEGRYHVKDGVLRKKFNNRYKIKSDKKYWFFLLNDILLYTTIPSSSGKCNYKHSIRLIDMSVKDVADSAKDKYGFEIVGHPKSFMVYAESEADKRAWMDVLRQQIANVQSGKPAKAD